MNKALIKKTRRPRGTVAPKKIVTRVTAEQYPSMHEYCLTQDDIDSQRRYQRKRDLQTGNVYIPRTPMVPVCEHPEQGFCSHDQPTPEQLAAINARLTSRYADHPEREEPGWTYVKKDAKMPKTGISPTRLTSKKRKYTKKPGVVYGRPKK